MNRKTAHGLSLAGVRKRVGGGGAFRSARSQRRAQEKAKRQVLKEFARLTDFESASAHPNGQSPLNALQDQLDRIDSQTLVP